MHRLSSFPPLLFTSDNNFITVSFSLDYRNFIFLLTFAIKEVVLFYILWDWRDAKFINLNWK